MDTVLITGASSGIGEALAGLFAKAGNDLVLVARSVDKLDRLAKQLRASHRVKVFVEPADLSKKGAPKKLAARLRQQQLEIDILVNSAGILEHGEFAATTNPVNQGLIDLNISALTAMLNEFLPGMLKRGHGRVLNVASIAAFQPVPSLAVYAATKAYVLSLTESLSEELSGSGVSITALCPGVTATNMLASAQDKSAGLKKLPGFVVGDVDDVAGQGFRACMKGEVICVPGMVNLAATISGRAMPKWMMRRISGAMGRFMGGA